MDYDVRPHALSVSSLVGKPVVSPAGEILGTLEELMLDMESGCVVYAVLSLRGVDRQLLALPWEALTLTEDNRQYLLHADRETLEGAPMFDRDQWPDVTYGYLGEIYEYYGVEPYWEDDEFESKGFDIDDDFGFLDGEEN